MAASRRLSITTITQNGNDLTNPANFANNTQAILVSVSYTAEHTNRTFIRVSIHLADHDPDETQSGRRHRKGDLMFAKNFRVTGGGGTAVTPAAFSLPGNKINLDYDHAVYVVHVREREGLAAATRNIARAA